MDVFILLLKLSNNFSYALNFSVESRGSRCFRGIIECSFIMNKGN